MFSWRLILTPPTCWTMFAAQQKVCTSGADNQLSGLLGRGRRIYGPYQEALWLVAQAWHDCTVSSLPRAQRLGALPEKHDAPAIRVKQSAI